MPVSFNRRSKVLLALVASMTLGSGLLLGLAPDPIPRHRGGIALSGSTDDAAAADFQPPTPLRADWSGIAVAATLDPKTTLKKLEEEGRLKRWQGCPYHFVISADGTVERSARWDRQGLDPDETRNIQIGLVGAGDGKHPATEAQRSAKDQLVKWLLGNTAVPPIEVSYR